MFKEMQMNNNKTNLVFIFAAVVLAVFGTILLSAVPIASAASTNPSPSFSCSLGITQLSIVSNSSTNIVSDSENSLAANIPASAAYAANPAWTANVPGATWIWSSFLDNPAGVEIVQFNRSFSIPGNIVSANLIMGVDNYGLLTINSNVIGSSYDSFGPSDYGSAPVVFNVANALNNNSVNQLQFSVTNEQGADSYANPAGLLYNLTLCYYQPIAILSFTNTTTNAITVGQSVGFKYVTSGGTGNNIYTYFVNGVKTAPNSNGSLTFSTAGIFNISFRVTDLSGETANSTSNVTVVVSAAPTPIANSNGGSGSDDTGGLIASGPSVPLVTVLNTTTVTTTVPTTTVAATTTIAAASSATGSTTTTLLPAPPASSAVGSTGQESTTPPSGINWDIAYGLLILLIILLILYYIYHYYRKEHRDMHHTKKARQNPPAS